MKALIYNNNNNNNLADGALEGVWEGKEVAGR